MSYKINATHYEFDNWSAKANKCRQFMAGEDVVKDAGEEYLPKLSGQSKQEYNAMLARTLFYGASKRTKLALSGAIHRKAPVIDIPTGYDDYLDDVSLQEVPFNIFAKEATDEILTTGKYVVCVDYDEELARPYVRGYNGEALINFRKETVYGKEVITMAVLEELREVETDDPFVPELVNSWRVKLLDNGVYKEQIYTSKDNKGKTFELVGEYVPTRNGQPLDFIPLVVINTSRLGPAYEESMLNDLVSVNIMHYITSADIGTVLHFSALPTLTLTGVDSSSFEDAGPIRLGSTNSILLPPGADAKILEFSGSSATALQAHLAELEKRCAILGARLLDPTATNPATATAEIVKSASEMTALASLTQTLDAGFKQILKIMMWWAGNENADVTVNHNRDFLNSKLSPSQLTALTDAYLKGGLSAEVYMHQLEQGEMLPPNADINAEIKRLNEKPEDTDGMRIRENDIPEVRTERNKGADTTIAETPNNQVQ